MTHEANALISGVGVHFEGHGEITVTQPLVFLPGFIRSCCNDPQPEVDIKENDKKIRAYLKT